MFVNYLNILSIGLIRVH